MFEAQDVTSLNTGLGLWLQSLLGYLMNALKEKCYQQNNSGAKFSVLKWKGGLLVPLLGGEI